MAKVVPVDERSGKSSSCCYSFWLCGKRQSDKGREPKETSEPIDEQIFNASQDLLTDALLQAKFRRQFNNFLSRTLSCITLVSNCIIMVAPAFGIGTEDDSPLQIILAAINTLTKGLEMQFQFASKADNLVAPIVRLEHLMIECVTLSAVPNSIEEAKGFLRKVETAVKELCQHTDLAPKKTFHNPINSELNRVLNDATMKALADDADLDDTLELERIMACLKRDKTKQTGTWNPHAMCGGQPAHLLAQEYIDNPVKGMKGMELEEAQQKVMDDFPDIFSDRPDAVDQEIFDIASNCLGARAKEALRNKRVSLAKFAQSLHQGGGCEDPEEDPCPALKTPNRMGKSHMKKCKEVLVQNSRLALELQSEIGLESHAHAIVPVSPPAPPPPPPPPLSLLP